MEQERLVNACPGCGSTLDEREAYVSKLTYEGDTDLIVCPLCDGLKCCICDMGNDVDCSNCIREKEESEDEGNG